MIRVRAVLCNWALGLLLALGAVSPALARDDQLVVILVSIDGFRPDYLDRGVTPNLNRLARGGVKAAMRPSFPSITFPNHWTLVTGLRPDHHGMVNGVMTDADHPGKVFTKVVEDSFWWEGGEPIWIAAERAGIRSATMFWPGSQAAIHGMRPSDWFAYHVDITNHQRVETVLDWLRRPAAIRPRLVTLYFGSVDIVGHRKGPFSAEVNAQVADVDAAVGRLQQGLAAMGRKANLVIVSDHGMGLVDHARIVWLKDWLDKADYKLVSQGPITFLNAVPGHEAALAAALHKMPTSVQCWPKADLPPRFAYGHNPRIADWVCLAQSGAIILDFVSDHPDDLGDHGYDPDSPEMRALFIANGPAFAKGAHIAPFDNVDIEPLLRDLIGLPQAAGRDGTDAVFQPVMPRPVTAKGKHHP